MSDAISGLSDKDLAELCAYADGSLPAARRAAVQARVAASPELLALVERQQRSLAATRALAAEPAPPGLAGAVSVRRAGAAPRPRRRLLVALSAAAALAAAVLVVVVLTVSGGAPPSVAAAAQFATQPPAGTAPAVVPGTARLTADVQGLAFPDLSHDFGWRTAGVRRGSVGGRPATVVYYVRQGRWFGYAIVAGHALPWPSGARMASRGGVRYAVMSWHGRTVVTWRRLGHTCVVAGRVRAADLLTMAAWHRGGAEQY